MRALLPGCERGERSVKKQTLILVVIAAILFVAGSVIAYASVRGASKSTNAGTNTVASTTTSAVVATKDIPAGTTGQAMVSNGWVAIQLVPTKSFVPSDLTSLQALNDEVLSGAIKKGQAVTATELDASTSAISVPVGLDAMTINVPGTAALAGYLQPGARVDVYANITKVSNNSAASATLPVPCTELSMADIQVIDVSSTSPSLAGTKGSGGRTLPSSETVLLAVTSGQARTLSFLSQNETVSLVQTQADTNPPPLAQCIGTDQTTSGS
jgi:Flp pilus assembly protein CpaB